MNMDPTIIINCAGGHIQFRLNKCVGDSLFELERCENETEGDEDTHFSSWESLGYYHSSEAAWLAVGQNLGWINLKGTKGP